MSGLEIPAFVIGISGMSALVEKSLAAWKALAESKQFGSDMDAIAAEMTMEYYRLLAWARASGALEEQSSTSRASQGHLDTQQLANHAQPGRAMVGDLRAPIELAVVRIVTLLEDMLAITAKYTPDEGPGHGITLRSHPTGGQGARNASVSSGSGLTATLPLFDLQKNPALISRIVQQKGRAEDLRRQTPFRLRFTFGTKPWGVPDKVALQEKVTKLCYWNDRLEALLPKAIRTSLSHQGLAAHILVDEDTKTLETLMKAAKHDNEGVRTHAKLWKERIDFASRQAAKDFDTSQYRRDHSALVDPLDLQPSKCGLALQLFQEPGIGLPIPVAVEWHSYESLHWDFEDLAIATGRLAELVHLSCMSDRPQSLRILSSICFVERESSLAIVHRLPENTSLTVQPVSLYGLLKSRVKNFRPPDLDRRLHLAQQLASSVYSFGLVRWFHKDFSSRNVVFFADTSTPAKVLLDAPFVVGWSISRPDSDKEKSLNKVLDALDIYLHPDLRVRDLENRPAYHRKYEIYSLGLVLFEIGLWRPIDAVVDSGLEAEALKQAVIERCTKDLGFFVGPKYRELVLRCLTCADDDGDEAAASLDTLYWSIVLEIAKLR